MTAPSAEGQWSARPWLAALVRVVIVGVPVVIGSLIARLLAGQVSDWSNRWASVAVVLTAAIAASVAVSRLTNRLLPLALLLRMTMIFPDHAPSRLKVARQTTSLAEIGTRLRSRRLDESEAATTMLALVTALSRHDRHTRGHSERVRLFSDLLAAELNLSPADAGRLRWAALVHDIGKLEVPAVVLNKPGKLNAREWLMIKRHPDAGARLAAPLQDWLGPWFSGIADHHERYDGLGYPRGLEGSAISLSGRAIALVDAFETMTAARSYKAARTTMAARACWTAPARRSAGKGNALRCSGGRRHGKSLRKSTRKPVERPKGAAASGAAVDWKASRPPAWSPSRPAHGMRTNFPRFAARPRQRGLLP